MRHALIIAGGSGTRLWPMSTKALPKQLIPFIKQPDGSHRSLLGIAMDRLAGLVPADRIWVCAGEATRAVMLDKLPDLHPDNFIGEPMGRDTLNAVGLGCGVIAKRDPDACVAIFTADHIITPVDAFQNIVSQGYDLAETNDNTLVTFGIAPTEAATGYGYLQLGEPIGDTSANAHVVDAFKEKPDASTADAYVTAGPSKYLWNSGMFVWKANAVMQCIEKYKPDNHATLQQITSHWGDDDTMAALPETFASLEKVSIDYAVMEPASQDPDVTVAAVPMPLSWLDVGSWPSFAETTEHDQAGNAVAARAVILDAANNLIASDDPDHLVTALGVENLIIIHTPKATLVCHADNAQDIKKLHGLVGDAFGDAYL